MKPRYYVFLPSGYGVSTTHLTETYAGLEIFPDAMHRVGEDLLPELLDLLADAGILPEFLVLVEH